jgi:hypothetical protein
MQNIQVYSTFQKNDTESDIKRRNCDKSLYFLYNDCAMKCLPFTYPVASSPQLFCNVMGR